MDLVSFFRQAEALPSPYPNPVVDPVHGRARHWYHGTIHEFSENEYDDEPPSPQDGGHLRAPERDAGEYWENSEKHWNTDLGVHFTSVHNTAKIFAHGGGHYGKPSRTSRVAHCHLHMANPKHYESEHDMAKECIDWAREQGYRWLPDDPSAHHSFSAHGQVPDTLDTPTPGEDVPVPYYNHPLGHDSSDESRAVRDSIIRIDKEGSKGAYHGRQADRYLASHPFREEITQGFKAHLQRLGHDGVTYGNEYEPPDKHVCAVPFDDEQINIHHWQWLDDEAAAKHDPERAQPAHDPNQTYLLDSYLRPPVSLTSHAAKEPEPVTAQDLMDLLGIPKGSSWTRTAPLAHQNGEGMHVPTPHAHEPSWAADGRRGWHPGDDLTGMYLHPKVAWVKTDRLWPHREFDRGAEGAAGDSRQVIDALKADITRDGFKEPIIVGHDPDSDTAIVDEGNHRLRAARELGLPAVPVHVMRAYKWRAKEDMAPQQRLHLGSHKVVPDRHGYTPGNLHPKDVFPDDYLYTPDQHKTASAEHPSADHPHLLEKGKSGYTNIPPHLVRYVRTDALAAMPGNNLRSQDTVDRIAEDLQSGEGLHDPIFVGHNPETGMARVEEGMHRIRAAGEAGVEYLPTVMYRSKYLRDRKDFPARRLPGTPPYWNDFDDPSLAFPAEDLHPLDRPSQKTAHTWQDNEPGFEEAPEGLSDEERSEHYDQQFSHRRAWQADMRRALSRGHLSIDEATQRGYSPSGHDIKDEYDPHSGWQPMSGDHYHVTTDLRGVLAHGLKSRDELGQHSGRGLGGGESDTISTTTNPELAHHILDSVREFHAVLTGKKTAQDLWDEARHGVGASEPFHRHVAEAGGYGKYEDSTGAPPSHIQDIIDGRTTEHHGMMSQEDMDQKHGPGVWSPHPDDEGYQLGGRTVHSRWTRKATPDEHLNHLASLYKSFSFWREQKGGKPDPMFFSTDIKGFSQMDPKNFGVVHLRPKPKAQGYPMHGMHEWRTCSGDAFDIVDHRKEANREHPANGWRYHVSPDRNRDSIGREGLFPGSAYDGPDGVYMANSLNDLRDYIGSGSTLRHDVYRVNVDGLRLGDDPMYDGASYSREPIEPERVERIGHTGEDGLLHLHGKEARYKHKHEWLPDARIFTPSKGSLDPRLFDPKTKKMLPQVAEVIVGDLDAYWGKRYPDWKNWTRVYLAGSQASEWWGNNDFDCLLGVNHKRLREAQPEFADMEDEQIDEYLTKGLREHLNDENWKAPWDGQVWHRTFFVNPNSWDIRKIKPYAAYEILRRRWWVEPLHTPKDWSARKLPESFWDEAEALVKQIDAIEQMPSVERLGRGSALFDYLHHDRRRAFSDQGKGVYDPGNVTWKYLDMHPDQPLAKLVALKRDYLKANPKLARRRASRNDEPERMWFHGSGTGERFEQFDFDKKKPGMGEDHRFWNSHLGAHFSSEHGTARDLAQSGGGHVYHVSLDMKNPKHYNSEFDLDNEAHDWADDHGYYDDKSLPYDMRDHPKAREIAHRFREHLQGQGHDGIVYGNEYEPPKGHECAIAFHPDQIRIHDIHGEWEDCKESGDICRACGHEGFLIGDKCTHCGEYQSDYDEDGNYKEARKTAVLDEAPVPNPYHDGEFSHTWFHGTNNDVEGDLDPSQHYTPEKMKYRGPPQTNKLLGTHFSALHSVSREFVSTRHDGHIFHASLHADHPAYFPTEHHLDRAIFRHAMTLPWFRDDEAYHSEYRGRYQTDPSDLAYQDHLVGDKEGLGRYSLDSGMEHVIRDHPRQREIAQSFVDHLRGQGHHVILYGNVVEGPYMHTSAIALHPDAIKVHSIDHYPAQDRPGYVDPVVHAQHERNDEHNESNDMLADINEHHCGVRERYARGRSSVNLGVPPAPEYVEPIHHVPVYEDLYYQHKYPRPFEPAPRSEGWARVHEGSKTGMGAAGPDYDNLTFEHRHDHFDHWLEAVHPEHGVVGHINYDVYQWPKGKHRQSIHVHEMEVAPEHQRRGVASQLMRELEARHPHVPIEHGLRSHDGWDWSESYYGPPSPGQSHLDPADWTLDGKPYNPYIASQWLGTASVVATNDPDYRMQHTAPGPDDAPLHDLTALYPEDVYTHPHYYGYTEGSDYRSWQTASSLRGRPNARVKIYRSMPREHAHHGIQPGDWVSIDRGYARDHGRHATDPSQDWPVVSATVLAKHLFTNGDSISEWGYHGPPIRSRRKPMPVLYDGPSKGFSFSGGEPGDTSVRINAWDPDGNYAGHIHSEDGEVTEIHVEPQHAHLDLEERLQEAHRRREKPRVGKWKSDIDMRTAVASPAQGEDRRSREDQQGGPRRAGLVRGRRRRPGPGHRGAADQGRLGGDGVDGGLRGLARLRLTSALEMHPRVKNDLKGLSGSNRKKAQDILAALDRGEHKDPANPLSSPPVTHPLRGRLNGWYATKINFQFRVVHRPTEDGGTYIGHIGGHNYEEAQQRLSVRRDVRDVSSDAGAQDGIMVAVVPPKDLAHRLAVEDGEGPEQLHITLAYLGSTDEYSKQQLDELQEIVAAWAEAHEPLKCTVQGAGTFVKADEDGQHVLWASVDAPGMERMHVSLVDWLARRGYEPRRDHVFVPHLTLSYERHHVRFLPKIERESWTADEVWVCVGGVWESVPLASAQ